MNTETEKTAKPRAEKARIELESIVVTKRNELAEKMANYFSQMAVALATNQPSTLAFRASKEARKWMELYPAQTACGSGS